MHHMDTYRCIHTPAYMEAIYDYYIIYASPIPICMGRILPDHVVSMNAHCSCMCTNMSISYFV